MTLLLLASLAVVVGSWRFTLALGLRRPVDVVTAWLVVLSAQTCLLVLGVGLAGSLRPVPLAATAGVVTASQVAWSLTAGRRAARQSGRRTWTVLGQAARRSWRHPIVLTLGLLVLGQYLWRLAIALRFPVLDYDGNSYHLLSVDTWVQSEAVTHTPQVVFADVFPQNSELVTAWAATFLHSTSLSGLTQFLFAALGTAAVTGIASNAGATRPRAVLAGLVFAATPIVFLQVGTGYVDIAAGATVLAAWQLLLSAYDQRREYSAERHLLTRHFLVAGLAVGMMVGTKSSNLLAALLAGLVAVVVLRRIWRERGAGSAAGDGTDDPSPGERGAGSDPDGAVGPATDPSAPRRPSPERPSPDLPSAVPAGRQGTLVLTAPAPVATPAVAVAPPMRFARWSAAPLWALLVPAMLVGGYWYARNLVTYGNPLWPITIPFFPGQGSVSELIIGSGNLPADLAAEPPLTQIIQSWSTDLFVHPFVYDQRLGGFGPQWLLLLVPAIAVMVLGFLRDRLGYLLGLLVPLAVLFLLQPASWWSRYTIFLAGLGAVCYPLATQWLAGRWERVIHIALVALIGIGMWWSVSPTFLGPNQADPLSPSEAVALLRADAPTRMTTRPPWDAYTALSDGPRDALVAIPDRNKLLFTHPYIGTELNRRLVVIPTPTGIDALRSSVRRIDADYVVLDPVGPTAGLAREARRPGSGFREVGRTYEGVLFAVG